MKIKNKITKTAIIIGTLLHINSVQASGFYTGISVQKSKFDFKGNNTSEYDDTASNYSLFSGYDFPKAAFTPYRLSLELSHFRDHNSTTTIVKDNLRQTDIKTDLISFNTVNHYHINDRISFFGVAGFNYANIRFRDDAVVDTEDSYGFNYGAGMSFRLPKIHNKDFYNRVTVRAKVVHSTVDLKPSAIDSIDRVDGITSISLDFKYNF